MTVLKTSEQWQTDLLPDTFVILDPDGWDRKNYQYSFYEEKIDIHEFTNRLWASTVYSQAEDIIQVNEAINKRMKGSK